MIDTSKYKWTSKKSEEDKGILTQEFHDEVANVKYTRLAFPNDLSEDDMKVMASIFKSAFCLTEAAVPNCMKCEIGPRSIEVLYFIDDDIEFRTKTELEPKLKELLGEKLTVTYNDIENNMKDFMSKVNVALANEEFIELFRDIYSKYIGKEL